MGQEFCVYVTECPPVGAARGPLALEARPRACDGCVPVSVRMCACVSPAVGRLAAQREGGRLLPCGCWRGGPLPATPSPPLDPSRGLVPRKGGGAQVPPAHRGVELSEANGGWPPRGGGYADLTSLLCRFSAVRTKMVSFLPRLSHMKTWLLLVGRAGLGGCLCSVPLILRRDSHSSS